MAFDFESVFRSTRDQLPEGFELSNIQYMGPDYEPNAWVALATSEHPDGQDWCEGNGATPADAAADLLRHVAEHHGELD